MLMIVIATGAFAGASYAQFTVTISGTAVSPTTASTDPFTVTAEPSVSVVKVVFYRNDIPIETDTSSPYVIAQNQLGQDNYTYRARAYDASGAWVDSPDYKLEVRTPKVYRIGGPNPPGAPSSNGPGRFTDHTEDIRAAISYLKSGRGSKGGTIVFPCLLPASGDNISVYNIRDTIDIPSDITLQGESAEWNSPCRIYWNDTTIYPGNDTTFLGCEYYTPAITHNRTMFRVPGANSRVRFKDLALYDWNLGAHCGGLPDYHWPLIESNGNTAIEINPDQGTGGNISDLIFENILISNFKYGIKAVSGAESTNQIYDVKIRGYRPLKNHRQLFINAKYAYDWDVQNINVMAMLNLQGAVEIVNAGKPPSYTGDNGELRFLQLNCNGNLDRTPAFCVQVGKHGGLYFRQLHHEGVHQAIIVNNISTATNPDPIIMEGSVTTGIFNDPSMSLYLIGNGIFAAPETASAGQDNGRLRFLGAGTESSVVDCGDLHADLTLVDGARKMSYTHSERNRGSFFAQDSLGNKYIKPHTVCPSNINEVGGESFNSGVMPTEAASDNLNQYSNKLTVSSLAGCQNGNVANCLEDLMDYNEVAPGNPPENGGAVYIVGQFTADRHINIPRGTQLIGAPGSKLTLASSVNDDLLLITAPFSTGFRASGIVIRNLELEAGQTGTGAGIAIVGETDPNPQPTPPGSPRIGASSDIHFSGLKIQGFAKGIDARPSSPSAVQPQVDGISLKNMSFVNNTAAINIFSGNASNWNAMNLNIQSASSQAAGWSQTYGGIHGLQGVTCQGPSSGPAMQDCIRLQETEGFYLSGLKKTQYVTNALTLNPNGTPPYGVPYDTPRFTSAILRNNDFTGGTVNVVGRSFITSFNNKYGSTYVDAQGDQTRLTYCGDTYPPGLPYSDLPVTQPNLWVGNDTPSRISCGPSPVGWDDAVRWTFNPADDFSTTRPLVGRFFSDTQEDVVVYQPGSQSHFLLQQRGGPGRKIADWGISSDTEMIGNFFPNRRSQLVIWRAGAWWVMDPNFPNSNCVSVLPTITCQTYLWNWGVAGDTPFVGNFTNDGDPMDDIAIYRPSTYTFWILNPRTGGGSIRTTLNVDNDSEIQVGNFIGTTATAAYDQIAQVKAGSWKILDPTTGLQYTANIPDIGSAAEDKLVAGRYLQTASGKNPCTQLGIWRPSVQKFYIADVNAVGTNCGDRTANLEWGLKNGSGPQDDDTPLTIRADNGLRRPTVYRRSKGSYPQSLADGQWWIHDLILVP